MKRFFIDSLILTICIITSCSSARTFEQDPSKSAFRYREVYLPEAIGKGAIDLGLNSVDLDWGIWGHNLYKVLPENPDSTIFALVEGKRDASQYCFSSEVLLGYVSDYIENNYGKDGKARFATLPNDNDIVCLCEICVEAGNTPNDASPALFSFIKKLSEKYPSHIFYTSDYRSARNLPSDSLPSNAGVMVSAISYPLSYLPSPQEISFLSNISEWKNKTDRVLVWDYINNFDDYFTPYPIFGVMQQRLQNYRDHQVTGIFLNGSGEDASSFSKLKSIILAELTANPDTDWRTLLMEKSRELYPVSGETIAEYILAQEDFIKENGSQLPLYEGVSVAMRRYLDPVVFQTFYERLKQLRGNAKENERKEIDTILAELTLTQLEINRITGSIEESERLLAELEKLNASGIPVYNESGWRLDHYIDDYRYMLDKRSETWQGNLLKGQKLEALSHLDEDYSDLSVLTDGLLGLPSNYHNGHLLNSNAPLTLKINDLPEGDERELTLWLTYNLPYRIGLPSSVAISSDDGFAQTIEVEKGDQLVGHYPVTFKIPANVSGTLTITISPSDSRMIGPSEITLR